MDHQLQLFLQLSSYLTGFERIEIVATGLLEANYKYVIANAIEISWPGNTAGFWSDVLGQNNSQLTEERVVELLSDRKFTLIFNNIIRMWYLGGWLVDPNNPFSGVVVSPMAYQEGLLWGAFGTHPNGAKQPGFGSWADKPLTVR